MYATIDTNGRATGFYRDTKHAEKVGISPTDTLVEITKAQWRELLENPGTCRWDADAGEVIAYTPSLPPLSAYQAAARVQIDAAAGRARARFTSPGELIEQEYQRAETVAREYAAAGYPETVPPAVQAEADRTGATAQEAADTIIARAEALYEALDTIRTARLQGKTAVDTCTAADPTAPTQSEVDAVKDVEANTITALDAIEPSVGVS